MGVRVDRQRAGWVLVAPFVVVFAVFTLYPLASSVVLATSRSFGPGASAPVGLENFALLARDPLFWKAVGNTLIFTAGSLFIQLPIAFGLAMLLNRPKLRGRALLRLVFFAPQLFGLVFVAVLAGVVFEKRTGLLNQVLHGLVGLPLDFPWLSEFVMPTLILVALWMYVGLNMVYFLAALQSIDRSLVEAALLDGAGPIARLRAVVLPAVRPVAGFVVLLSIIGSLQLFELPYILFDGAGPQDRALTVVTYLYQQGFEVGDLGYASAVGWALALLIVGATIAQRVIQGRGEPA